MHHILLHIKDAKVPICAAGKEPCSARRQLPAEDILDIDGSNQKLQILQNLR